MEKNKIFYINKDSYKSSLLKGDDYNSNIKVNTISLNYLLKKINLTLKLIISQSIPRVMSLIL